MAWPGHSPDVNASEHAWPWIRRHVMRQFISSCTVEECQRQWEAEWEEMPIEVINQWVLGVIEVVRRIIITMETMAFMGSRNTEKSLLYSFIYN